ncbi:unnamed protein product [Caenorhabditis sp. 36 PRJEB53466]|nr:unnamed protein product [Caenorhabditis sp. 36 PRJEB53466]
MVSASKTIMTNEISMPSLGHKENTFRQLQPKENLPTRYRSARFDRLRAAPENVNPVFVNPAVLETEEPNFVSSRPTPIQVVPSSETVTEIPMESPPTSHETPAEPAPTFSEFSIESSPTELTSTFEEVPTKVSPAFHEIPFGVSPSFHEIPAETLPPFHEFPTDASPISQETSQKLEGTSEVPTEVHYAQERVYPTAVSVTPTIEFVGVPPSSQIEVTSTNVVGIEEIPTSSTKTPKKRRHRRKHRKLRKITKVTEDPTQVTTTTELQTEPPTTTLTSTMTSSKPTATTTKSPPSTAVPQTPSTPAPFQMFPTAGSFGPKIGESYLGGWNEDEGVIVTTSGPSLGMALNQFSEIPASIAISDDKAIKEYYEKYYAEWYQKHNQASNTPVDPTSAPREIKIELAKPLSSESATQPTGLSSSTAPPTKEQLDKVCDYVAKISKSFGIKDLVGFTKNNCSFVKSFHPTATCEQIQHLMSYCVTGVENQTEVPAASDKGDTTLHYAFALEMCSTNYCLAIALLVGVVTAQDPRLTACDATQLNTCQSQLNTKLGFDASLGVTKYQDLRSAIEKSFADGQAYGLLTTCEAYKEYQQCYTDSNFFSCSQNPYGLLTASNNGNTQFTQDQANGYVKIWNQLDFVCGAGFSIFANAETCASAVFNNQTDVMRQCDNDFNTNAQLDPAQACAYVEIAANCYYQLFWNACKIPEVAYWGCNYERTGTNLLYPQCSQIFCTFHERV